MIAMGGFQFSKLIILFETTLVLVLTLGTLLFCYLSITMNYTGSLTFLTTVTTASWAAYGASVAFYYDKAKQENTIKIANSQNNTTT